MKPQNAFISYSNKVPVSKIEKFLEIKRTENKFANK